MIIVIWLIWFTLIYDTWITGYELLIFNYIPNLSYDNQVNYGKMNLTKWISEYGFDMYVETL